MEQSKFRRQETDEKENLERRLKKEMKDIFLENFSPCLEEGGGGTESNIKKIVRTPKIARLVKI
jgi:hypothetical protein